MYWLIDNGPATARFLTPDDRVKAVERLRSNNTGTKTEGQFNWRQTVELFSEPKTWVFLLQSLCVNMGASVFSVL